MGSDEQTYISLIADSRDNLHAVYRRWVPARDARGQLATQGVLAYQKFDGRQWSPPKNIVYPNMTGYFIYYQHLTVDRRDNLYLNYSRWSTQSPYCGLNSRGACATDVVPQFSRTALLKSENGDDEWHLATDRDIMKEQ